MTRSDDKPEVRDRLLETGIRIFATRGYEGATVREICEQSQSNIAAINYYFGDKKGFYEAVKDHARMLRRNSLERTWEIARQDPWRALRLRVESLLEAAYDSLMFYVNWLFMRELLDNDSPTPVSADLEMSKQHRLYEERMMNLLKGLLGEACSSVNMRLLRYTFQSMCLFLPIQTTVERKYLEGHGLFSMSSPLDRGILTDFIMHTVRRTVNDMRKTQTAVEPTVD